VADEVNISSTPELTVKSILLGIVLSMVLASAMAYLGLFAGMTISASIPAAAVQNYRVSAARLPR